MSKNICLVQARWLGVERFKHCVRKKIALFPYAIIALKMPIRKRLL